MATDTRSTPGGPATPSSASSGTSRTSADWSDPSYQAFRALQLGFVVAPILAGLDKFLGLLTDWTQYLWPPFADTLGMSPGAFMGVVGVVEIVAGVVVALKPRFGGYLVAAWLTGIILNLVLVGGFWDIALRDLGLAIGAFALARLATARGGVTRGPGAPGGAGVAARGRA